MQKQQYNYPSSTPYRRLLIDDSPSRQRESDNRESTCSTPVTSRSVMETSSHSSSAFHTPPSPHRRYQPRHSSLTVMPVQNRRRSSGYRRKSRRYDNEKATPQVMVVSDSIQQSGKGDEVTVLELVMPQITDDGQNHICPLCDQYQDHLRLLEREEERLKNLQAKIAFEEWQLNRKKSQLNIGTCSTETRSCQTLPIMCVESIATQTPRLQLEEQAVQTPPKFHQEQAVQTPIQHEKRPKDQGIQTPRCSSTSPRPPAIRRSIKEDTVVVVPKSGEGSSTATWLVLQTTTTHNYDAHKGSDGQRHGGVHAYSGVFGIGTLAYSTKTKSKSLHSTFGTKSSPKQR